MTTVTLTPDLSRWVSQRSRELGMTPDEVVSDALRRQRAVSEFRALTSEIGEEARRRGLTAEKLTDLLDGETYE